VRLLAVGRDCDVFDLGDGTVLRRARDGRSLEREAAVLRHARSHGLRCPEVRSCDGADLVLELVEGPTQLHDLLVDPTPERADASGRLLAEVHDAVHAVPAIDGDGTLVHLDLHPANVLLGPEGPVVIDFTNATAGPPALDVADTWLVVEGVGSQFLEVAPFLDAFLAAFDRDEVAAQLPAAYRRRAADPNMGAAERAAMEAVVRSNG
jgi:tRNA A-37 threonylcarbamoyl transferase component Bud32